MNIALLTDGIYPYVIGGMQKHSYQLAKYFAANGHTVYLFHCNESKYDILKLEFFTIQEKQNIKSYVIPFPHKKYFPFHYIYESYLYSKAMKEALEKIDDKPDFIFAQGFCAWAYLKGSQEKYSVPVAVHFHGYEMFQYVPSFKNQITKYLLRGIVKTNLSLTDYAISFGGKITGLISHIVTKEKIWEIPGWIENTWETENKNQAGSTVKFVFVGRNERRKGINELNSAIKNMAGKYDFSFEFIGPIPDDMRLNLKGITYHGQLSPETAIKDILSQSDVLVCPSYAEGMPYVIMEAMACGMAIIATNVGAVEALVNNGNGWIIGSPEPSVIANAMINAIESGRDAINLKKRASSTKIKEFYIDKVISHLVNKMNDSVKKLISHS